MLQRCRPWRLAQLSVRNYGTGRLPRPISVAPMVDISTPSFLELLHIISGSERYAYYTEMHHAHAILHHSDHLARFVGRPRSNVVVQLGGSEPQLMAKAAKILEDNGYQEVNINVGCPSPRVQSGQFGAVLMKSPDVVAKILEAMTTAEVSIPVTIKCRLGVDDLDTFDFLYQFVETLLNCKRPPPHLIVHARKCILQGLSPKDNRSIPPLNYDRVYRLAETFPSLPISINGGFNDTLMVSMALSKVDGCMIGRQIMNDPLFLQRLDQEIYGIPETELPSRRVIIERYLEYAEKLLATNIGSQDYGLPPLTLLVKPLMMLFKGRQGRTFRRELTNQLRSKPTGIRPLVSNTLANAGIPL